MPTGDKVRSGADEYVLERPLKAGMIGLVYEAKHAVTGQKMAVKVPVPNLSAEGRQRFWQEYDVLQALTDQMRGLTLTVPKVEKGTVVGRDEEALLLEFVPERLVFTSKVLPLLELPDGLAGEKLALAAAGQYARLLEHLHAAKYTCPDRKLADLRWQPSGDSGRLIVLDWNVVEKDNGADDAQVKERRKNDLYLFGSLWYQLLAGRYPSANMNALDDGRWRQGKISYGTRLLVIQALEGGFETAQNLRTAVQERLNVLNQPVEALEKEALDLYPAVVTPPRDARPDFVQEWQALDFADLAVRLGAGLEDEREKLREIVEKQGDRLVSVVQQSFLTTRYDDGETAVQEVLAQAESLATSRQDIPLKLRIARWQTLIRAGKMAITEGHGLRPHREKLAKVVKYLEDGVSEKFYGSQWEDQVKAVKQLLQATGYDPDAVKPETAGNQLADFYREARAWQQWALAEASSNKGEYEKAVMAVDSVRSFLDDMVAYRVELEAQWPNLDAQKKLYRDREAARRLRDAWESQIDIENALGRPAHIAYVLSTTLPALEPQLGSEQKVMEMKEPLVLLANLYRQVAYARMHPDFWPGVLQSLGEALANEQLRPLLQKEAREIIKTGYQDAEKLAALGTSHADDLAAKIYTDGLKAQQGLSR